MLGDSGMVESSGDAAPEKGASNGGTNSGEEKKGVRADIEVGELGDRTASFGSIRWPRQETLTLLKIRSEMDAAFRDSTLKTPLWEEVSRKLAKLGYHRTPKKCKEKFENVSKYHKRTKEGHRTGKSEGKTYRFFHQLEALENLHSFSSESKREAAIPRTTTTTLMPSIGTNNPHISNINVPSTFNTNPTLLQSNVNIRPPTTNPTFFSQPALTAPLATNSTYTGYYNSSSNFSNNTSPSNRFLSSPSSSTPSDDEIEGKRSRKKRRYRKGFFKRLTKEVMEKQEEMQKFLETLERRENERIVREEDWRVQETARINREHEILVHERSKALAKDAALISFLQKISEQQQLQQQQQQQQIEKQYPTNLQSCTTRTVSLQHNQKQETILVDTSSKMDNGETNLVAPSSSRWPKAEVEALIRLRASLDAKYQENAPKGPLWEEISAAMRMLGYNRSAKRCKEKWENMNKYYKKVKETSRKRPEDSNTCSYFHQLDALYSPNKAAYNCSHPQKI